jgi:hypothetical protein
MYEPTVRETVHSQATRDASVPEKLPSLRGVRYVPSNTFQMPDVCPRSTSPGMKNL